VGTCGGVGFSAATTASEKAIDELAGKKTDKAWLNPEDMAVQAAAMGLLRVPHLKGKPAPETAPRSEVAMTPEQEAALDARLKAREEAKATKALPAPEPVKALPAPEAQAPLRPEVMDREMQLIDLTLRMFIEPKLVLDPALLTEHLANVQDIRDNLLAKVRDMMLEGADPDFVHAVYTEGDEGITKLLMSNAKFAEVLVKLGVVPPMKVSPTTGKETFAFAKTDPGLQELLEDPNPMVQTVVSARLGVKSTIEETRTLRFIDMSHRGPMPIPLRYYGAHSGRWSGQDKINLQNLASRGVHGGKLKKAIKAPEGYVIIDCDSAQIEARTLAWLAGQDDLVQAFRNKQDVYKIMASHIYGIPIEEVTTAQRQVGKTVILGAGYGVGHAKLQLFLKTTAKVDVDAAEAKRIIDTYRETYPRIPALWKRAQEALRALKYGQEASIDVPGLCRTDSIGITLPSGLHIQYPGLESVETDKGVQWTYTAKGVQTKVYGGLVVENFTQAIARCVVAEQMLRISKRYFVPMMVHDAAAALAPIDQADEARAYVEECMSWTPKWATGLPLACESGMGASYGDC